MCATVTRLFFPAPTHQNSLARDFAWEDQSEVAYCIVHKVLIKRITVLYESYRTVVRLIGKIKNSYVLNWANTAHSGKYSTLGQIQCSYAKSLLKECYVNT